jgi:site-specific recombinase XerD
MTKTKKTTVAAAIEMFVTEGMPAKGLAARTRTEYARDLAQLEAALDIRGLHDLPDVHGGHLGQFMVAMERRGNSLSTRRRKALSVRSFFRFATERGFIAQNPAERMIPPRVPRKEPRFLSEVEYKELLRACSHHPRDAALIELLLQTGMRLAEAARLTVNDLDLPARPSPDPENVGTVRVVRKGGAVETIPLNYKACQALSSWLKARPREAGPGLWITKFGRPMSRRAIQYMVASHFKRIGIEGASVHSLRHTMATHHVARGTDLKTLQETLGHRSLTTTALYVGLAKRAQRRALQENAL